MRGRAPVGTRARIWCTCSGQCRALLSAPLTSSFRKCKAVALSLLLFACSATAPGPAQTPSPLEASPDKVVTLPPGLRVKQLALGDYHTCALLESGRVACWGNNEWGQLGTGSNEKRSFAPGLVPHVADAVRSGRAEIPPAPERRAAPSPAGETTRSDRQTRSSMPS
jgi:alpha-tubulin suppressor-like RCC1 family protein